MEDEKAALAASMNARVAPQDRRAAARRRPLRREGDHETSRASAPARAVAVVALVSALVLGPAALGAGEVWRQDADEGHGELFSPMEDQPDTAQPARPAT
ncbi:MAG: hypothetical protein ACLTMP_14175 [Eggerthella lenta]